jgi:hypothetical protein
LRPLGSGRHRRIGGLDGAGPGYGHHVSDAEPIREPENSTVDDWLGQRVARDEELADELVKDSGGDLDKAAERFEQKSDEGDEWREQHEQS